MRILEPRGILLSTMALSSIARWVVLGALFLIPFLPLYVDPSLFFPFITSKGFAFRILIGIALGAYVLLALLDRRYRPKFSWTLGLYGLFVAWMFIANLLAENAHKAFWSNFERMDGFVTLIHVFIFFLIAGAVLSADKLWKRWWQVVLAASALVSIHGVFQLLGMAEIHQGGMRVDANFGNAIYFAVYLMFTIGIALWQAFESKGFVRYALLALAALQLVLVFMSATRGVIVALAAAAVLVSAAFAVSAGGTVRKAAVGALGVIVILGGTFFLLRDSALVQSDPALARLSTVFDAKELTVRLTLWDMAREGFLDRPITGWGQDGYNYVFNEHYRPSLLAQEPWFDRAHNTYLDWLIAGGAPALLLFLALLVSAFRALLLSPASRTERFILAGILVAYAVQAIAAFDNLFSYILLAALLAMAHERSARTIPSLEKGPELDATSAGAIALPTVLVVTAIVVWSVNVPNIEAGKDLIRAASSSNPEVAIGYFETAAGRNSFAGQEISEQMVTFAGNIVNVPSIPPEIKQRAFELAFTTIQEELNQAPKDARLRLLYAQGLRAAGLQAEYRAELEIAQALAPKKQTIFFQRGLDKWQSGDRKGAAEDFEAAYALDPNFDLSAAYVASGRYLIGDAQGADDALLARFGTTSVWVDPLRFALFETNRFDQLLASSRARVAAENSAMSRFLLAQALVAMGRVAEGRAEIEATMSAFPESAAEGAALLQQLGGQ